MGLLEWFRRAFGRGEEGPVPAAEGGVAAAEKPVGPVASSVSGAPGSPGAPAARGSLPGDYTSPDWVDVPAFLEVEDARERALVSAIATAVAAGDRPDSKFVVRRVARENPEHRRLAVIAAAVCAGERPASSFACARVLRHEGRIGEETHAS